MVIFSTVTGAVSDDFVAKFPQHFNFVEMLESVCEETGTRVVNQGNNGLEIVGDWSQMTFVHGMLENTLAIYGAVAMVSGVYAPAKDLKITPNKRILPPDQNVNDTGMRDGYVGMREQVDIRDRPFTPGNTSDRYYDSRVGTYTMANNTDRYFDTRSNPYMQSTGSSRTFDNRGWPYIYPSGNMADTRGTSYMPPQNTADKFYDSRGGPYMPGYSGDRQYDARTAPYPQTNMMDRQFDNRDRTFTPGNVGDGPYNSNVGLQTASVSEKIPPNLGDNLGLPPLDTSSVPSIGSAIGTTETRESTVVADVPAQQMEITPCSNSLPVKETMNNVINQVSDVGETTTSRGEPADDKTEETGLKPDKEVKTEPVKQENDQKVTEPEAEKSPGVPEEEEEGEAIEDVKSDHEEAEYHLDSDTDELSEEVDYNEESDDSLISVKETKRKYRKRRVERQPKRFTRSSKKKMNRKYMQKQKTKPVEGKRRRGRPRNTEGPDFNIPCSDCGFLAKDRKSLYAHNRRAHLNVPTPCDICGKMYPSLFDMKRHRVLIHNPPKYSCDLCGKRYKVNTSLKLHVKSHEPGYVKPVYPCVSCDKSFANPSLLRTHTKRRHEPETESEREVREVKHFCFICHKTFSSKAALQEHTKIIHMRIYDHQCDQCGKVFGYEKSLATHKLIHSSAKNFVCKICGKAFKQKSCMTIHQAIHMEKKFLCGHCGRGFTQRQSLRRHDIIHRGEKPYSCKLCGQSFNSISTIRRHVILVHKLQKDSSVWREDITVDTDLLASITM